MKYSDNFQDNIYPEMFNQNSQRVLSWIKENRSQFDWAKDPNAYEMVNIFLFGGKYAKEGNSIDLETLKQMWDIRSKDFENCGISEKHFVYSICEDAYQAAMAGRPLVDDENSHFALRKMAGIGLYLKQQQRDGQEIQYNNPQELMGLIRTAKTLREKHLELFKKYRFIENIDVLCNLQFEKNLPEQLKSEIEKMKNELSSPTTMRTTDDLDGEDGR